ncbi:hypothetical protein H311_01413 [Anncaliia algerae PRA109]|nr:hypothetical protein H311_01413 [Anncaliia algerae PRA109]
MNFFKQKYRKPKIFTSFSKNKTIKTHGNKGSDQISADRKIQMQILFSIPYALFFEMLILVLFKHLKLLALKYRIYFISTIIFKLFCCIFYFLSNFNHKFYRINILFSVLADLIRIIGLSVTLANQTLYSIQIILFNYTLPITFTREICMFFSLNCLSFNIYRLTENDSFKRIDELTLSFAVISIYSRICCNYPSFVFDFIYLFIAIIISALLYLIITQKILIKRVIFNRKYLRDIEEIFFISCLYFWLYIICNYQNTIELKI